MISKAMVKIGRLELGRIPRIALSLGDQESLQEITGSGADLLEVRVDSFRKLDNQYVLERVKKLKAFGLPMILTVRTKDEGAKVFISESKRLSLFYSLVPFVDAVDIEFRSSILKKIIRLARDNKKTVIVSMHDFKNTPSQMRLEQLFKRAKSLRADIVKIAAKANNKEDVIRLLLFTLKHRANNLISISLGRRGAVSRVLFPFCGSLITYSCLRQPFAPGQISQNELARQFRMYYQGK